MTARRYDGIPALKAWMHNIVVCRRKEPALYADGTPKIDSRTRAPKFDTMGHALAAVGWAYREVADARTMTAFLGRDKLEALTGIESRNARHYREVLERFGWLVDTGERRGQYRQTVVYRLAVPHCGCGRHDELVMAAVTAEERQRRAVAVVQGYERGVVATPEGGSDQREGGSGYAAHSRVVQTSPTDESVQTNDANERARERDAGRGACVAPLDGPRTTDRATADQREADGLTASAATQDDDESATSDREETTRMTCNGCGALSDAPLCDVCDPDGSPAAVAARTGLRAENGGTPGGHDPGLPAPAAALLAALQDRGPLSTLDALRVIRSAGGRFAYEGTGPIIARDLAHRVRGDDGDEWLAFGPALVIEDDELPPDMVA